ncbi:hypothetical protein [Fulvivirga sedimenti]|uniref:Uncharacterized protein n=1 Tax=Fulvivirga sedimenti TaxID=2879465 RepID=A0A9X1HX13_9BACT|nr:hypothetical protein [Fulvivirga sedimenti]MCA6077977.1 hypothetical protein [Fulvivirga sedimenti]
MKRQLVFLMFILLAGLSSCSEDDYEPIVITAINTSLKNPVDGQRSYYVRYTGSCNFPASAIYTGDTLILSVKEIDEELYFSESFTPGSPLFKQNASPVTYRIEKKEDYLLLPDRFSSALFYFYGNDTLFTNVADRAPLYQSGCKLRIDDSIFTGNEIGMVPSFRFGKVRFDNLTAVSCIPLFLELDAYLFYNTYLHASHSISSNDQVSGWVLTGI